MSIAHTVRKYISPTNSVRLMYHKIWAMVAAIIYGFPARKMIIIGVTGTDGKTTTCRLTHSILGSAGLKSGMASTVEFRIGEEIYRNTTHKTTLGRFGLQKILREMKNKGCTHVVIETSSHAVAQRRIWGIPYDITVLTNVTPEHLDYHKTFQSYRYEKAKLFRSLKKSKRKGVLKTIILNKEDHEFPYFNKIKAEKTITYGHTLDADVQSINEEFFQEGSEFSIITTKRKIRVKLHLPCAFNIQNALAAASVGIALDLKDEDIREGLEKVKEIPGRMERIELGQDFEVIIDFAMTPHGYETLLKNLKAITKNELWLVFGCCGDRDKGKRSIIGEIAGNICDKIIITDDEPYSEDPEKIIEMIEQGVIKTKLKKGKDYFLIQDRRDAIEFALLQAKKGDTVVVPGMGDLEGRTMKHGIMEWSDRKIITEILEKIMNDQKLSTNTRTNRAS